MFSIALITSVICTQPSLGNLMPNARWWRFPLLVVLLSALSAGLWQLRSWVSPAALRLTDITVFHQVDVAQRKPIGNVKQLDVKTLQSEGLYSWTAVKAPRGLNEKIFHVWILNNQVVERIALDITGGREQGYRAWTHKMSFPQIPLGNGKCRLLPSQGN